MPEVTKKEAASYGLDDLLYLMRRLRDPDDGCPWDLEQSYKTIVPSTIEEAYEVADAIEREDLPALKEELGDYLFQAVFYCQLAEEEGRFDMDTVIDELVGKLIRRHPHVFPGGTLESRRDESTASQKAQVSQNWEALKQEERNRKGLEGVFDDIPKALPALVGAQKVQKRAAKQKFDWDSVSPVYEKIQEEIAEVKQAVLETDALSVEEEIGDLLFSCVNLARHLKVDSETALRRSTKKFTRRYLVMLAEFDKTQSERPFEQLNPEQMDRLWRQAKAVIEANADELAVASIDRDSSRL